MEPTVPRIDPLALLVNELDVYSELDAAADPSGTPLSVLTVDNNVPAGPYTRWSFEVTATLTTFAGTAARAWAAHTSTADRILALETVGHTAVSGVQCTQEPVNLTGSPTGPTWPGLVSTYSMYMRYTGE